MVSTLQTVEHCQRCGMIGTKAQVEDCPQCAYLETVPHPHRISKDSNTCSLCDLTIYLTDRDRKMMNTTGQCLGVKGQGRLCKRSPGNICFGRAHPECRDV